MPDFLDNIVNAATNVVDLATNGGADSAPKDPPEMQQYNSAQKTFGTAGGDGYDTYNLPKMKYNFIVEFELTEFAQNFITTQLPDSHTGFTSSSVSFFVRDTGLPSMSFEVETLNQYNRNRHGTGKVSYKPINMAIYDTVDSVGLLLFDAYKKYYYGDFFRKNEFSYNNDVLSSSDYFEYMDFNWGRSLLNSGNSDRQYFFKRINIYEIDNQLYTCHNIHNVFVKDIQMDTKTRTSNGEPSILNVQFVFEACSNMSPNGYPAIGISTLDIADLITDTEGMGRIGYWKYYGETDDAFGALSSVEQLVMAGSAALDVVTNVADIAQNGLSTDNIRNIAGAVSTGATAVGAGGALSSASSSFGLGNLLGDF